MGAEKALGNPKNSQRYKKLKKKNQQVFKETLELNNIIEEVKR